MELWDDDLEYRVSGLSCATRDEILLLVDSGYSRRAIYKRTGTAVDVIEYLVANRMRDYVLSDDDSDADRTEKDSAATPSGCDLETGTSKDQSKEQKNEQNALPCKPVCESQKSKEVHAGIRKLRGKVKCTPEQEEAITHLHEKGMNARKIAKQVGVGRSTAYAVLKAAGTVNGNTSRSMRTPQQEEAILQLFDKGTQQTKIAKRVGVHRDTVRKVLKLAGKIGSNPVQIPEAAILQLFEEGFCRNEIVRRAKIARNVVTNVLLLHGKSFAQRNRNAPEPVRATEEHRSAIRLLSEKGWSQAHIARQLGVDQRIVKREIYLAQRTEQIKAPDVVSVMDAQMEDANPPTSSNSGTDQPKQNTVKQRNSPEYPDSDTTASASFSLSVESLSDSSAAAAVRVFDGALTLSSTGCGSPDMQEKSHSYAQNNPASTSVTCTGSILSGQNDCCDFLDASSTVKDVDRNPQKNAACVPAESTAPSPAGRQYRCGMCVFETHSEAVFISHLLGTKHTLLASKGVILRCAACSFRTRQQNKMVGHAVTYQFHCPPDKADVYSIASTS